MKTQLLAILLATTVPCMAQDMTRYVEPHEQAFSIEVPAGWSVSGGINRRSPIQPHNVMTLISSGHGTIVMLGNPQAITYSTPTPLGVKLGFREGTLYSPNGNPTIIEQYKTGRQFALAMGGNLLNKVGCQNVQVIGSRERPVAPTSAEGISQTNTSGEAFFSCEKNGHQYDGYMFSLSTMTGQPDQPGGAIWDADMSYFFATPHGNGMAAGALLSQIIQSVQMNPQWVDAQVGAAHSSMAATSRQMDQFLASESRVIAQSFRDTQAQQAQTQDEMHRLISGFDEYQTANGERKTVTYGAATNWWSSNQGTVGTQGPLSPGAQYTPLTRVPLGQGQ